MESVRIWVGRYAPPEQGIALFAMPPLGGMLFCAGNIVGLSNPSFLLLRSPWIFAAHECSDHACIASYHMESSGRVRLVDSLKVEGAGTCHLALTASGRFLYGANYQSGSVVAAAVADDGRLSCVEILQHSGSSIHPRRQTSPHVHSVTLSPDNRFALVADLGCDRIFMYQLDSVSGKLTPHPIQPQYSLSPGDGPRHMAFHPNGQSVYLVTELSNRLYTYQYDPQGLLTHRSVCSTLPDDYLGENLAADIHLSRDGRFLYVTNRGHDSFAVWEIDANTGIPSSPRWYPCGGRWPRHFAFGPHETTILVANQRSQTLCVWERDSKSGAIGKCIDSKEIVSPSWVGWTAFPPKNDAAPQ